MSKGYSRRELFSRLFRRGTTRPPARHGPIHPAVAGSSSADPAQPQVAIILGRFCLAFDHGCQICADACPVPGALPMVNGLPMVERDLCTGCGVCRDVCPAEPKAVMLQPRAPRP
ncbi:MAG: hypothetical protein D6766_08630 [Verrucomicrobia bacterium]|nr:MAG: hypothetical protein D6766_08630 [Verrucomicrobiota bacterium]